jgi:p24 family protein delta-1
MHLLSILTFLLPLTLTSALKFEVHAQPQGHVTPRCIRNFVGEDTLVVVTARVSGNKGDGQRVNIEVTLSFRRDIDDRFGIQRGMSMVVLEMLRVRPEWRLLHMAILQLMFVLRISSVKVVLALIVLIIGYGMGPSRTVELDVDIGSSAFDYAAIQKSEVPFL